MEEKKDLGVVKVIVLTIIVTTAFWYIIFKLYQINKVLAYGSEYASTEIVSNTTSEISKIKRAKAIIDTEYLREYDSDKMVDATISGMLRGIDDPYAAYYNAKDFEDFFTYTEGYYAGIGVLILYDDEASMPLIYGVVKDSPAFEVGLKGGDRIMAVDSLSYTNSTYDELADAIKGPEGTEVKLQIMREVSGEEVEILDYTVTRKKIELYKFSDEVLEDNIGYIKITNFDETTYENFKTAYDKFVNDGMQGLIVDLRNNPGGILQICAQIVDELVPEGKIVYTINKAGKQYELRSDKRKIEIPLVVLVNGNSASASEVFTGAVKDYGVGTIIGTKTFGKGVVQSIKKLGDGSYIKLTTEEYFSPSGNKIDGKGITPDIEIDLPEDVTYSSSLSLEEDTQLQKAIEVIKTKIQETKGK